MQRRAFLKLLGLAAAGVALAPALELDPERALWVPGAKRIFDLGGAPELEDVAWTPDDTLLTPDWIAREALQVLSDKLAFMEQLNRDYDLSFPAPGVRVMAPIPRRWADLALPRGPDLRTLELNAIILPDHDHA